MAVRVFKQGLYLQLLLLAIFEACVFILLVSGFTVFYAPPEARISIVLVTIRASVVAFVFLTCILSMGLYQSAQRLNIEGILIRLAAAFAAATVVLAVLNYLFPLLSLGRKTLLSTGILAYLILAIGRWVFSQLFVQKLFKKRVLVYGAGKRAERILNLRRRVDRIGFNVVGFVSDGGDVSTGFSGNVIERPGSLLDYAIEHDIDEIVVAMQNRRNNFPVGELLECRVCGIKVTNLTYFLERETGKIDFDLVGPSWLIFSEDVTKSAAYSVPKRIMDILAATFLLVLTMPVMLLAALAIRLESSAGDPILYRQTRVGFQGKPFRLVKFRSMKVDAEKDGKAQWAGEDDDRITRSGEILRKYRIDELPQLVNVLFGEMSLVGPRPERPEFVDKLATKLPYYRERHCAIPGLTGWAQLLYPYGANEEQAAEKLRYDLYYVMNRTLLFDIMILLQTVEVIFWKKGAR